MYSIRSAINLQLKIILLSASVIHAAFDLTIEPEAGFQTNVPVDTMYRDLLFFALGAEPVWTSETLAKIRGVISAPLNATKFIGGLGELNFAPELCIERTAASHTTGITIGAAYHYMPVALDPTIPDNFLEFSLQAERENTGKIPLTGTYSFSILNDLASSRTDFKNTLRLRLSRKNVARLPAFIRIGCSWNISNSKGAGYIQPHTAAGISIPINDRNLLLLQLFAAGSFYNPTDVPVLTTIGRGKWGKKTDTLVTYELSEPRIPFMSLYCGYDRELTRHLSTHFYYTAMLFGRGRPDSMLLSHQSGIIFSYGRE